MKLNLICQGLAVKPPKVTAIDVANFSKILAAAGPNTLVTLANAQSRPLAELAPVIQSAGSRHLALEIDATRASEDQTLKLINSAIGQNTSLSISSINSFTSQAVTNVVNAGKSKKLSIHIDGSNTSQTQAVHIINSVKNTNIPLTFASINALPSQSIPIVFSTAGSKALSAQINAETSTIAQAINVINNATPATTLSLVNAEALGYSGIIQIIQAAQSKSLNIGINAEKITIENLKSVIQTTTPNMAVSISMAHGITASNLSEVVKLSGDKKLSISMSGKASTTDQLKKTVSAAKKNTSITIDTAHSPALNVMLDLISSSGDTNLTAIYNGTQLVVTPTDGSYVIRALEVAKPTTSIAVNSIGVTNFNLQLILDIVNAAQ
ncbi:hypothetical protein ISF14_26480 [Pseudomonas aeruginosa]|uniref:hypothetical protein n=1 Tax=Pseudomonas aeruginosa TaxID=287 RepID=UPI0015BCD08C|nr:hypothetical protein [Pseudomonas aeruginosa]MBX6070399.1 hypothetical protein [Pseudomonas aeruginosa]MBX6246132.1 hypothetical protein [Pseudomonas aeruginosa]MBX6650192.1 hypothetical protein [Pseudomonas aeruginosa]MBX6908267.1 hypothetical protein [Pseudomonas aeruginosa]MCZ9674023.1 hypothetical protein [Pseudomonas aeruginosa]